MDSALRGIERHISAMNGYMQKQVSRTVCFVSQYSPVSQFLK